MRLMSPAILWLLIPWLALMFTWLGVERRARAHMARFASPALLRILIRGANASRRRNRFICLWLAIFFGIMALSRPQIGNREETIPSEGLDLVFLLDVSNSMLTEDVVPSRLKKAKHIIRNFVERLSGDRVGIVAFAGSAYPAVPLTTDYEFLGQTLEILDENSVANQGTDLAKGLQVSLDLLARGSMFDGDDDAKAAQDRGSRVIVIVSDGEALEGNEMKLVPRVKELGTRVYSIAVGSLKGGAVPVRDEQGYLRGYKKDVLGNMIHTKLESANLEAIASKTGGKFYIASANEGEVEEILNGLSSLERAQGGGRKVVVFDEVYQYPLFVAVALLLFMLFLREGVEKSASRVESVQNKGAAASLAVFVIFFCGYLALASQSAFAAAKSLEEYRDTKKGLRSYADQDFAGAVREFTEAQAQNPDSPTHHRNLGDALLKAGSPEAAIREFEQATKAPTVDPLERAKNAYNLGRAYDMQGQHERALQSFQDGLATLLKNPGKSDVEVELRLKRALEVSQQRKQQQDQKQDQKQNQGEKDQKKDQSQEQGDKQKQAQDQQQKKDGPTRQGQKRQFKGEKLTEEDAKRLLQQMTEQEKKSQQRVMRNKTNRPKGEKNQKDW